MCQGNLWPSNPTTNWRTSISSGLRVVGMVKGDEEVVEGTAAAIQPSEEGADNIWMENEGRGRAKQGGGNWKYGIYRILYRNRIVVLSLLLLLLLLLLLSFFPFSFSFFSAFSSGFAEMGLGQTGAYPWNGESGAISAGVIAVLREGEKKRRRKRTVS